MKHLYSFIFVLSLIHSFSSSTAHAQSIEDNDDTMISIAPSAFGAGGSMYDVPRGYNMDKYGPERLTPVGSGFKVEFESDKFGQLYIRAISIKRKEDGKDVENQSTIEYKTPQITLAKDTFTPGMNFFTRGDVIYYSQADHYVYFGLKPEEASYFTNNSALIIAPEAGLSYEKNYTNGDFKISGKGSVSAIPVGYSNSSTNEAVFGGDIRVAGVVKYKDRIYLKVQISQNYLQGYDPRGIVSSNRVGHYEAGYILNRYFTLNAYAENSELVLVNGSRHAIDVFNLVGAGIKYKIGYNRSR